MSNKGDRYYSIFEHGEPASFSNKRDKHWEGSITFPRVVETASVGNPLLGRGCSGGSWHRGSRLVL